ncbi:MAG TPA: PDZ domain-containing protein [Gemmatimonadales bacterium]
MSTLRTMIMAVLLAATGRGAAAAQELRVLTHGPECAEDDPVIGWLGYTGLVCNCTHYFDAHDQTNSRWEFRSEPVIFGIDPDGPADGPLRPGDAIVSIDGYLITTAEGGKRFAQIQPNRPVRLRVRRGDREFDVTITPGSACVPPPPPPRPPRPAREPAPRVAPLPPAAPTPPTPAVGPLPPLPPPSARLGLSLSCSQCGMHHAGGRDQVWWFSTPPTVEGVERSGPAYQAGIRSGDVITAIDGTDITSEEGGRRFGAIQPGDRVRFAYRRDGERRIATLTAGRPPVRVAEVPRPSPSPTPAPRAPRAPRVQPDVVRFTGLLGDALIEVTGQPVTVTQSETEIIIRSGDITVRIRKTSEQERER